MDIMPAIQDRILQRLTKFKNEATALAVKETGALQRSIEVITENRPENTVIKIRFKIYALILYHMSKSGFRQRVKKGGHSKGYQRYQGARKLKEQSPLQTNPEKYQAFPDAVYEFRDEVSDWLADVAAQEAINQITAILKPKT